MGIGSSSFNDLKERLEDLLNSLLELQPRANTLSDLEAEDAISGIANSIDIDDIELKFSLLSLDNIMKDIQKRISRLAEKEKEVLSPLMKEIEKVYGALPGRVRNIRINPKIVVNGADTSFSSSSSDSFSFSPSGSSTSGRGSSLSRTPTPSPRHTPEPKRSPSPQPGPSRKM